MDPKSFRRFDRQLYSSARQFGQTALKAHLDNNWAVFFLHAGVSLEHLAKSYLAGHHPSFIGDSFDFLLSVHRLPYAPRHSRTIAMHEAIRRCNHLIPDLRAIDLSTLIALRNGVAHLGESERGQAVDILTSFLRASQMLISHVGKQPADFWDTFTAHVHMHLSKASTEIQKRTSAKITAAQIRAQSLLTSVSPEQLPLIVQLMESRLTRTDKLRERVFPCPACRNPSLIRGDIEIEWTAHVSDQPEDVRAMGVRPQRVDFTPRDLTCPVCSLHLENDEIRAAHVFPSDIAQAWTYPDDFSADDLASADLFRDYYDDTYYNENYDEDYSQEYGPGLGDY